MTATHPATVQTSRGWHGGWLDGLRYGGLGMPLAFVALPLYVVLPSHYAQTFGVPLAALGTVLLVARLADAAVDPFIGRWVDGWLDASRGQRPARALGMAILAGIVLALGFAALFHPPARGQAFLLAWCAITLGIAYLAYSVLSVMHQAWGARLGGAEPQRARIVSWREGTITLWSAENTMDCHVYFLCSKSPHASFSYLAARCPCASSYCWISDARWNITETRWICFPSNIPANAPFSFRSIF